MPIVRKQLKPSDVYPSGLRYDDTTDTVQTFVNGEWVDSPDADPRNKTTFPPRITSDPSCDAAESVKDAFKGQIDNILIAIEASQTVFTIAGIILSLLTFGAYGVFVALALALGHAMLDAGTTAINAALTPAVYHKFVCILNCNMDAMGRLVGGSLGDIYSRIDEDIGGLGAVILKAEVGLAVEGGINNLGALGTSTGDCSDCICSTCPLDNWVVQVGTEISRTEATITADSFQSGSDHIIALNSPGTNMDCCSMTYELISGATPTLIGAIDCANPQTGSYIYYSYVGHSANYYLLVAPAAFRAKVRGS